MARNTRMLSVNMGHGDVYSGDIPGRAAISREIMR